MSILLIFITLLLSWMIKKYVFRFNHHVHKNQPPSPPKLPVLGNLHQLSALTHRAFQTLGAKHGPVMLLHFGSRPAIVVQSADTAAQIIKDHDLIFADKPHFSSTRRLLYDNKDVIFAPYGEYWRKLKSICVLQLLSNKRVQSYKFIREEETALLLEEIDSCCLSETAVDLSQLFDLHSNNVICRAAFGRRFVGGRFAVVLRELFRLMATVEIGEFVPWLSWISRVNGFDRRVEKVREEVDEFLEMVVEEHISRGLEGSDAVGENKEFFLDILLKASIDRDGIKAILLVHHSLLLCSVLKIFICELL